MSPSEQEIQGQMDARVRAVRSKDVDALLAAYDPSVLTFDIVVPLMNRGVGAVRERVREWFGSFEGGIDYELRDVSLAVHGDVAFDHHITHVKGTSKAGGEIDMWFRETIGYRRLDGKWRVTHQHSSVPFDVTSGKARLDLRA